MALTAKQRRFCDEYIIDFNATQAAIRAGYSKKTANRIGPENLSKPVIQNYIKERTEDADKARIVSGDEVLAFLSEVMCGDLEATHVDGDGCKTAYIDQRNQIKAAELLAKCHGLMTQRVDLQGPVSITFVDNLEDDVPNDG